MALSRTNRLKKEKEIRRIFTEGTAVRNGFFFLRKKENSLPDTRIGFSISAKKIPEATERNRIRRVISEYIQNEMQNIRGGYDILIGLSAKPDGRHLTTDIAAIIKKAGLLKE